MSSRIRPWCFGLVIAIGLLAGARVADAMPLASVEYVATPLGGGLFEYDYTLRNLSDPIDDAGVDIYDLALFFAPTTSLVAPLPGPWDTIGGAGFLDTFSLLPGEMPAGTDLGPGMLLHLGFVLDGEADLPSFEVTFTNPADPANPLIADGIATPVTATVPEPGPLLLVATGLALLLANRWRFAHADPSASAVSASRHEQLQPGQQTLQPRGGGRAIEHRHAA